MKVLAFDPGGTTGAALLRSDEVRGVIAILRVDEFPDWRNLDREMQIASGADFVVYERLLARHPSFNPIGLEVTGVIKYLADRLGFPLVMQSPSMMTPSFRRFPEINETFKSQHIRDAVAHGIACISYRAPRVYRLEDMTR